MHVLRMVDLPLAGRRVLIREDLNVPIRDGAVASDARLAAALPSIEFALKQGARVILMSHLGRPEEGRFDAAFSLRPVARRLGQLLGRPVALVDCWTQGAEVGPGHAALLENVRFERGEKADDPDLAARMAALCDIFVMDAFGSAHRAHASTHGVARLAPEACAGPLLVGELEALAAALEQPSGPPRSPSSAAPRSLPSSASCRLSPARIDALILGGGIANTLLAAAGHPVGRSLHEPEMLEFARRLQGGQFGAADIPLPSDVVVAEALDETARGSTRGVDEVGDEEMILDIGPRKRRWNTPAVFNGPAPYSGTGRWASSSIPEFARGTKGRSARPLRQAAHSPSRAAAIRWRRSSSSAYRDGISCLSTGGGAFLEFLEGRELPAVAVSEGTGRRRTAETELQHAGVTRATPERLRYSDTGRQGSVSWTRTRLPKSGAEPKSSPRLGRQRMTRRCWSRCFLPVPMYSGSTCPTAQRGRTRIGFRQVRDSFGTNRAGRRAHVRSAGPENSHRTIRQGRRGAWGGSAIHTGYRSGRRPGR